jgi:glycosyltransferase involved in cell wall biosynthesis
VRVVHVFRGYREYLGELVNSEAEGAEVHVLVSQRDVPMVADLKSSVHVHHTEMPRVRNPLNAVRLPALRSLIRQIDPDIVHLQSGGLLWENALLLAPRRCPVILTVHDVLNHPSRSGLRLTPELVTAYGIKSADALIVHGDSCRELLVKLHGQTVDLSQIHSVDHGVITRFGKGSAQSVVPQGSGNVLFFGRIDKYKGLEYLIEAEPILRSFVPGVSIVVAGAAMSHSGYYRNLVGSTSSVSLRLGYQDRDSVERLFRWADVVVLPYIEASQSGVLQIATAFSVPPVVTKVGGLADVIRDRVNGLLVEPRDPFALATAIRELLTNFQLRDRIISSLQADREGRFSWSHIAARTLDIYREVIARFQSRG